jgi:hypothetical protein
LAQLPTNQIIVNAVSEENWESFIFDFGSVCGIIWHLKQFFFFLI